MPVETLAGQATNWQSGGTGTRRAHFLHCTFGAIRAWRGLFQALETDISWTAVDLPGHGGSADPAQGANWQRLSADASLDLLAREDGPVDLVGHSFGATVALVMAYIAPHKVRSLTLCEPIQFGFLDDAGRPAFQTALDANAEMARRFADGDTMGAAANFITAWGVPGEWERMSPERQQAIADKIWLVMAQDQAIYERNDTRLNLRDLPDLKMPVRIISGGRSPSFVHEIAEVMIEALPNAQALEIATAGHMAPITHAPQFADLCREFWAGMGV